jgi:aspartate 1-decarboxylase
MTTKLKTLISKAKITHTTTGHLRLDPNIMDYANIAQYEQVHIYDKYTGIWTTTYVVAAPTYGDGTVAVPVGMLNDDHIGSKVDVAIYCNVDPEIDHKPLILELSNNNKYISEK